MVLSFDFSETQDRIFLTFYKPPRDKSLGGFVDSPRIELQDPRTLVFNSEKISLHAPVRMHGVVNTDYKTEVSLCKEMPSKWGSIDGHVDVPRAREGVYDAPAEEQSETSLMNLLKGIYAKGDEDVKRAMNKSLEESGGTILSTNWNDVKSKRVTPDDS